MQVFLDVGAHYGETLEVALDPQWGFDRIYSFEPSQACHRLLRGYRDKRLVLVPAGLSDKAGQTVLYGAGLLGGSVYADKKQHDDQVEQETIVLERATDWVGSHTTDDDDLYLKLNCEGSECDVLDDLLDSGLIRRVRSVYVDFDVRKIPTQAHRQALVEQRLREAGVDYATPATLGSDTNEGVRRWLSRVCDRSAPSRRAVAYRLGLYRPPYVWAKTVARTLLPRPAFYWVGRRLGSQRRAALAARLSRPGAPR